MKKGAAETAPTFRSHIVTEFYFSDALSTRKVEVIELSIVERNCIRTVWPL